jgi:hypothetical protein
MLGIVRAGARHGHATPRFVNNPAYRGLDGAVLAGGAA